jgi:hypothetical protein
MFSSDLAVVDNHAALTLPGVLGAKTYPQIAWPAPATARRIAATSGTTPQVLIISHEVKGVGFRARIRSLISHRYSKLDQDPSLTDGVVPSMTWNLTCDRPLQSAGAITDAIILNNLGALLDVILTSGATAKFLNQET